MIKSELGAVWQFICSLVGFVPFAGQPKEAAASKTAPHPQTRSATPPPTDPMQWEDPPSSLGERSDPRGEPSDTSTSPGSAGGSPGGSSLRGEDAQGGEGAQAQLVSSPPASVAALSQQWQSLSVDEHLRDQMSSDYVRQLGADGLPMNGGVVRWVCFAVLCVLA